MWGPLCGGVSCAVDVGRGPTAFAAHDVLSASKVAPDASRSDLRRRRAARDRDPPPTAVVVAPGRASS